MSDLGSAISSAFDQVQSAPEAHSTPAEAPESQPVEAAAEPTEKAEAPAETPKEEPTGDLLLDKLTAEELVAVKTDPKLSKIYRGLMQSYTPKMQALSEQQKLWDALNNEQTRKQAVESLARSVGLNVQPETQAALVADKTAAAADKMLERATALFGPEAAAELVPFFRELAKDSVQGTLEPLQKTAEMVHKEAAQRQGEAQVAQFKILAKEKGWNLTPEVEKKMAEYGLQMAPTRLNPVTNQLEVVAFETVEQGVKYLERCYRLATAEDAEAEMEKRVHERMKKAANSAEPSRGVPSTGREKRSNITKEMSLEQSLDVAVEELGFGR